MGDRLSWSRPAGTHSASETMPTWVVSMRLPGGETIEKLVSDYSWEVARDRAKEEWAGELGMDDTVDIEVVDVRDRA